MNFRSTCFDTCLEDDGGWRRGRGSRDKTASNGERRPEKEHRLRLGHHYDAAMDWRRGCSYEREMAEGEAVNDCDED